MKLSAPKSSFDSTPKLSMKGGIDSGSATYASAKPFTSFESMLVPVCVKRNKSSRRVEISEEYLRTVYYPFRT